MGPSVRGEPWLYSAPWSTKIFKIWTLPSLPVMVLASRQTEPSWHGKANIWLRWEWQTKLNLYSEIQKIFQALESVPCCNNTSISLPFNSIVVKNLLAVMSCGISLPLSRDDLLNVKVCFLSDWEQTIKQSLFLPSNTFNIHWEMSSNRRYLTQG